MISQRIARGQLEPGQKLPSCRELSRQLGVSRNTVVAAFQVLIDNGFVRSVHKSGYFVAPGAVPRQRGHSGGESASPRLFDRLAPRLRPSGGNRIVRPEDWHSYPFPFVCNQLDMGSFPLNEWRHCTGRALARDLLPLVNSDNLYGDFPDLIDQIRSRLLPRRGIYARREEILLTMGAQQGLYLVAALLGGPDRTIAIEDPGYPDARNIFAMTFGNVRPIPVDAEGLIVDARLEGCDMVYVTPCHQYPTTVALAPARRAALMEFARCRNLIVIEDDYDSETNFSAAPPSALRAEADDLPMIYVGSLSKSLSPGLRLGYLVAPADLIREARDLRGAMLRHPPTMLQAAASVFIRLGYQDALLRRLQGLYRRRHAIAMQAIARVFPEAQVLSGPGSSNLMLTLPDAGDLGGVAARALAEGVVIDDIDACHAMPPAVRRSLRIGLSAIPEDRIAPGLAALRRAIDAHLARSAPSAKVPRLRLR